MEIDAICIYCKNYTGKKNKTTCKAFPRNIPDEVWSGNNDHSEPLTKQKNNIVFEKIK